MRGLENIALGFGGIEKAYAISAGREVRVFVKPTDLDNLGSIKLARDIANKIGVLRSFGDNFPLFVPLSGRWK